MANSGVSTLVFTETNLGTRIAVPIPADISVKDFKGELERVHLNCFPEYGSIGTDTIMVKLRSCYYYLPESLPLKYAFQGSNDNWFLRVQVHMPNNNYRSDSVKCNVIKVINHKSADDGVTDSMLVRGSSCSGDKNIMICKRKRQKILINPYHKTLLLKIPTIFYLRRKRKNMKKGNRRDKIKSQGLGYKLQPGVATRTELHWRKEWNSGVAVEALSETPSEKVSVSGIINKYFSDYDEVASSLRFPFTPVQGRYKGRLHSSKDSKYSSVLPNLMSPIVIHQPLENPDSEVLREKRRKPEVGKRVLLASNSIGLTPSNERPTLSVSKFNDKRSIYNSAAMVRTLVFEISDEGD